VTNPAAVALDTIWQGCAAYARAGATVGAGPVRWFATGIGYEALNGVFGGAAAPSAPDALAAFRAAAVPALWHLGCATGDAAPTAPTALRPYEVEPLMVIDLVDRPAPVLPGVSILPAHTPAAVAAWVTAWTGQRISPAARAAARLRLAAGPAFSHLLAVADGTVIGCAAAFAGPEAGEVQHVVTLPGHRRRGVGTALTVTALRTLRGRGLRTATLTASPDGDRLYRRLGFRPIGRVHRYLWTPADEANRELITQPDVFRNRPAPRNDVPVQGG
jgi:ribosomal protein S18 acetylase RimI-like enzyme